jgi:aldehyde:ferredoxin oxidoreductase
MAQAEVEMGPGGQGDRLVRVDMSTQTISIESFPKKWRLLGGRSLVARVLREECDPNCDPLGPDNILILAPGVLAGTAAPTSGRLSVGAKSPLTGGSKEANTGGNPGQHLMKLGYRAVFVTGQPADAEARYGLEFDSEGVRIVPADDLKGVWNYAACEELSTRYDKSASFITCGPAGELQLGGASVATTDQDNRYPTRHAARGGLGAVMGSKGLKFAAVSPGKSRARQAADKKEFGGLVKGFSKRYLAGPQTMAKGTAASVGMANMMHTFPTRNRTSGQFEHADKLDGRHILENFDSRGGGMHNCLTGCIVQCSNVVHDAEGSYITSALEFESITMLGANCCIGDLDEVARLDRLCDDVGLDTIETGAAIAIYMDAGKMEFGDAEGAKGLLQEIADGTPLGRMIGDGAVTTGRETGHARVPTFRGQAIPAWDPRPLKATGVTYATSAQGADHTAGLVIKPGQPEEKWAKASQKSQITNAICDASGFCMFISPTVEEIRQFFSAYFGEEVSAQEIADYGWQILLDEWAFSDDAGFELSDGVIPACVKEDAIGPENDMVFDAKPETLAAVRKLQVSPEELCPAVATG